MSQVLARPASLLTPRRHFLKVASGMAVDELVEQIERQPELWGEYGWRREIREGPHAGMTDIWVRYNALSKLLTDGPYAEHDSVWFPAYDRLPALKPILREMMHIVDGERLGGVLITKIPNGAGIARHKDGGWHVEYYDKFYLSLKSAPGAKFVCHQGADEVLEPKKGEVWRFDNRLEHSVENTSGEDRWTMIVCIRTEKYQGPYVRGA